MTDTANLQLMEKIYAQHGAAIAEACKASAIPPAFVAALIANESGGNPDAKRFEKNVLADLWEVLLGRKANYGSISTRNIADHIERVTSSLDNADSFVRLDRLASSWGLTQIMGYHVLDKTLVPVPALDPSTMTAINMSLYYTVALLERFAKEFHIDERREFEKLFRCWNSGHPDGKTFDPEYVPNGLIRMKLYENLE